MPWVVFAEDVRAHVPIGSLTVVGFAAPRCGFEDGHQFGVKGSASAGSAATCSRACCSDSTEYTYKPSLAFVCCQDSVATAPPALSSSAQASMCRCASGSSWVDQATRC